MGNRNTRAFTSQVRWAVFVLLWICFIWGHSLIQGPESSQESGLVYQLTAPLFRAVGIADMDTATFLIRKAAHFSEYAVLGLGIRNLTRAIGAGQRSLFFASWVLGCLVPVCDETIQLFVPGRSGCVRDVCIDLAGFAVGALLTHLYQKRRRREGESGSSR